MITAVHQHSLTLTPTNMKTINLAKQIASQKRESSTVMTTAGITITWKEITTIGEQESEKGSNNEENTNSIRKRI